MNNISLSTDPQKNFIRCALGILGCAAIIAHEHSSDTMQRGSVLLQPGTLHLDTPPVLPSDDKDRKALPVWDGVVMYFPAALIEVARVSKLGNDQHNPGQPLHWAREKSTDHMNTALRHMIDHGTGNIRDKDGAYHLAKAAWRILAALQTQIEKDQGWKVALRTEGM